MAGISQLLAPICIPNRCMHTLSFACLNAPSHEMCGVRTLTDAPGPAHAYTWCIWNTQCMGHVEFQMAVIPCVPGALCPGCNAEIGRPAAAAESAAGPHAGPPGPRIDDTASQSTRHAPAPDNGPCKQVFSIQIACPIYHSSSCCGHCMLAGSSLDM